MELGYALACPRRVVISAQAGTALPFDPHKLPTYFWQDFGTPAERQQVYGDWLDRYIELPPLVE